MNHTEENQPDFGTGKKKLGIYIIGLAICSILTLVAFGTVMANALPNGRFLLHLFRCCVQLFNSTHLLFALAHANSKVKIMSWHSLLTAVIFTIVVGSLWIAWNELQHDVYVVVYFTSSCPLSALMISTRTLQAL